MLGKSVTDYSGCVTLSFSSSPPSWELFEDNRGLVEEIKLHQ